KVREMLARKSLGFISKIILVINMIAVAFLLLSYLAPIVKPQSFWPIAFMGIAYPVFLAINILFVLFWLFRKPSIALLSFIAIVIGWSAINKNFGFNAEPVLAEKNDSSAIRVMSYNIQMFNNSNKTGVDAR